MIQMKEQIKREREVLLKEQNKRIERLEVSLAWPGIGHGLQNKALEQQEGRVES